MPWGFVDKQGIGLWQAVTLVSVTQRHVWFQGVVGPILPEQGVAPGAPCRCNIVFTSTTHLNDSQWVEI